MLASRYSIFSGSDVLVNNASARTLHDGVKEVSIPGTTSFLQGLPQLLVCSEVWLNIYASKVLASIVFPDETRGVVMDHLFQDVREHRVLVVELPPAPLGILPNRSRDRYPVEVQQSGNS